ncbi:MAG: preprotein translocase subunit YajC [Lachnospiraceae bacterium]|jgi:preprotein translocase subunit YajC|nr:preprotein translocase subunit YajC [Lachnospiraceae bacterium]
MYNLLLDAAANTSGGLLGGIGIWGTVAYIAVFGVFIYLVVVRPQKKEQKKIQAMLSSMEVGDSVVTTSGFYGVIIDITDEDVIVEFGSNKNCRIPMKKSAIAQIEKAE